MSHCVRHAVAVVYVRFRIRVFFLRLLYATERTDTAVKTKSTVDTVERKG